MNANIYKQVKILLAISILWSQILFSASPSSVFAQMPFQAAATAPGVENQFEYIKHHGEALAWRNPEHLGAIDSSGSDHYQGLVRYPGEGVPVFYVTQLDDDDPATPPALPGGYLHVVVFESRDTNGERLRSNLMEIGTNTADTLPDVDDTWLRSIRFDGTQIDGIELAAYKHPGSMAIVDDILFVPLDSPTDEGADPTPATGYILLFDLSGFPTDNNENGVPDCREKPTLIKAIELSHKIDNLAVVKKDDGKYLIWVNGDGGKETYFYETSGSGLRDNGLTLNMVQVWNPAFPHHYSSYPSGDSWPEGTQAHQSSTFVLQTDGTLYLVGMRSTSALPDFGIDYAHLYRVDWDQSSQIYKLVSLIKSNLHCSFDLGRVTRICHFAAANNAYVSPSGQLILYSMPHGDEEQDVDLVWMAEFRNQYLSYSRTCGNAPYGSWAELYDDSYFEDRSIMFEWADKDKEDFNDLSEHDGFDNKTSSVRWCAQPGCEIVLYEHNNYDGESNSLPFSTGHAIGINIGLGVSSIRFEGNCTPNTPPEVNIGKDIDIFEKGIFTRTGSFTDPDMDIWTASVNYDDGSGNHLLNVETDKTFALNHVYNEVGVFELKVEVTDDNGNSDEETIPITVKKRPNPAPIYLLLMELE